MLAVGAALFVGGAGTAWYASRHTYETTRGGPSFELWDRDYKPHLIAAIAAMTLGAGFVGFAWLKSGQS